MPVQVPQTNTRRVVRCCLTAAAVVVVAVAGCAKQERQAALTCNGNLTFLGKMLKGYAGDHHGRLPSGADQAWPNLRPLFCLNDKAGWDRCCSANKAITGREYPLFGDLSEIRARGIPITDYEMPAAIAGAFVGKLPPNTILLEEHGTGHDGRHRVLYADGTLGWVDGVLTHTVSVSEARQSGIRGKGWTKAEGKGVVLYYSSSESRARLENNNDHEVSITRYVDGRRRAIFVLEAARGTNLRPLGRSEKFSIDDGSNTAPVLLGWN